MNWKTILLLPITILLEVTLLNAVFSFTDLSHMTFPNLSTRFWWENFGLLLAKRSHMTITNKMVVVAK